MRKKQVKSCGEKAKVEHHPCQYRKREMRDGFMADRCYAICWEEPGDLLCEYCVDRKAREYERRKKYQNRKK